ncbi:L,D-transpeptidase [Pseudonocardia sp. Cha107L01]|uniref:L,D-transpeptidase n=1 Tax=Pseudonocardia sp. Cha107L01 TaxID=3457576 RepID=UPI00403E650A
MADDNSDGDSSAQSASDSGSSDSGSSDDNSSDDNSGSDAPDVATYESTPCTESARACVDLAKQQAWLLDGQGNVTLGPVPLSSGGPGKETPVGTFHVQWKDKNHKSQEFKLPNGQGAPMLWSVFWADGGIAFHGGSVRRASAGCVHLSDADAQTFYNTLQLGDEVQVH